MKFPARLALLISLLSSGLMAGGAPGRPNIIVFFTDDHGYADLSCQGIRADVKTPHLDRMAGEGARFTHGYVTAPQCCPSRAGLLTGRDQNRFGHISNGHGPLPLSETTLADHLAKAGYTTGMVGKWHLEPNHSDKRFLEANGIKDGKIPPALDRKFHPRSRGFQETFFGYLNRYSVTYNLEGKHFPEPRALNVPGDRIDVQSAAAVRFIDLHHDKPFFLYVAHYAPHVPMSSSKKYLDRFPGDMPERRRCALAMISAIDEGVGLVLDKLRQHGLENKTLVFFIGDNGAPLKLNMEDTPLEVDGAYWNGSMNMPLNGEKGMLAEGGIRVPYLMRWKGVIPPGQVVSTPVTSLDVAATTTTAAGLGRPANFDGLDLLPMLTINQALPERPLYWRFWRQSAIRLGNWKLLKFGNRATYLFDLSNDPGEKVNLLGKNPEVARKLTEQLDAWENGLCPPDTGSPQEHQFYHRYFNLPLPAGAAESGNSKNPNHRESLK